MILFGASTREEPSSSSSIVILVIIVIVIIYYSDCNNCSNISNITITGRISGTQGGTLLQRYYTKVLRAVRSTIAGPDISQHKVVGDMLRHFS